MPYALVYDWRPTVKLHDVRIAVEALMREDLVVDLYERRSYRVITRTEAATREYFHMPMGATADVVIEVSPRRDIVAEVKGSDLAHALVQLRNTVKYVRKVYDFVECKAFLKTPTPPGNLASLRGGEGEEGRLGFVAMRVFHSHFPAEWLLLRHMDGGGRDFVRIDGQTVNVIFGPYAKA
jgi:hypothetical protein